MTRPCAVCSPSACTSVMNTSGPARRCQPRTIPNSADCFIALMVSVPALARSLTLAFEACACSNAELKSLVLSGTFPEPRILPPPATANALVSRSSA
jgi:hypothetical protein